MPSSSDTQKVLINFINPMMAHFSKKLSDEQIAGYVEDLCGFPEKVLDTARIICRRTNRYFPQVNEALAACREAEGFHSTGSGKPINTKFPWEEEQERRVKLRNEYLKIFMKGSLAQQADAEDWAYLLRRYVVAAADVQAQLLLPRSDGRIAIDSATLNLSFESRLDFVNDQRRRCEIGTINIEIPSKEIDEWKARAVREKPKDRYAA